MGTPLQGRIGAGRGGTELAAKEGWGQDGGPMRGRMGCPPP